jgi:alpha-tubulin suppressor-like RCC1 family protein
MKTWFVVVFLLAGTSLNSLAQCCPPFFATQPQNTTNVQGTTATFWAVANGGGSAVSYQWKFNGVNIAGATATNYVISNVQPSNAGVYSVAGTNAAGWVISSNATLTVIVPPPANDNFSNRISLSTTNVTTTGSNQNATKEAGEPNITGNPGGSSVWWTWTAPNNGFVTVSTIGSSFDTLLGIYSGNNVASLSLVASDDNSGGGGTSLCSFHAVAGVSYQIAVDGFNGVSGNITLNLLEVGDPGITNQPVNVTKTETGTATFTVGVTGTTPLSYQWRFYVTNNLPGATSSSLTLNNVQAWNAGNYSVLVSNPYGSVTSATAVLTVTFPVSTVACWGDNTSNKATVPIGLSAGYQAIAAGGNHSLALKTNGIVVGWGDNSYGQISVPTLTDVTAIAAGYYHSLALRSNGTVVTWGDNSFGQTNTPPGLSNVVSISAGAYHNLALKDDGTVVAWGNNADGETDVPPSVTNAVQIAAGYYHNLALLKNGSVVGWGFNGHNECNMPGSVTTPIARLSCGNGFSLALLTNGSIAAWGDNSLNQTNISPNQNSNIVAIAAGGSHSLCLKANGAVFGWGQNTYGETSIPFVISKMVAISAGAYHSMSLEGSGAPYITVQPASQRVASGNNVGFFVMAAGTTSALKYQWQFNGANIANATNSAYTRLNVQLADAGSYTAVLSNVLGLVTSSAATLTVDSTSTSLTALGFTNSGFQFRLSGPSGIYIIDASSDLFIWDPISTNTIPVNSTVVTDPAAFSYPYRFYRARQ